MQSDVDEIAGISKRHQVDTSSGLSIDSPVLLKTHHALVV